MQEVVSSESLFRRLPTDLPRRQVLYADALRLSAEMADFAHKRLVALVQEIVDKNAPDGWAVYALLESYSIIDSAFRFREILRATPGIKHNTTFELFIRRTQKIETLRHIIQHLRGEIDTIAAEGLAALGTITWLGPSAAPDGPPTAWILQPGTSYPGQWTHGPVVDTYSSLPDKEISDISLATAGAKINLTEIVSHLRSMIKSLEPSLEEFAKGKELFGSDVIMHFELIPIPEGETQEPEAENIGDDTDAA